MVDLDPLQSTHRRDEQAGGAPCATDIFSLLEAALVSPYAINQIRGRKAHHERRQPKLHRTRRIHHRESLRRTNVAGSYRGELRALWTEEARGRAGAVR